MYRVNIFNYLFLNDTQARIISDTAIVLSFHTISVSISRFLNLLQTLADTLLSVGPEISIRSYIFL